MKLIQERKKHSQGGSKRNISAHLFISIFQISLLKRMNKSKEYVGTRKRFLDFVHPATIAPLRGLLANGTTKDADAYRL